MGKNTSVSLGDHFEKFINSSVKSGRYGSASDVIRTALRMLENEEKKLAALRKAIVTGIDSGIVEDFDSQDFLRKWKAGRKK